MAATLPRCFIAVNAKGSPGPLLLILLVLDMADVLRCVAQRAVKYCKVKEKNLYQSNQRKSGKGGTTGDGENGRKEREVESVFGSLVQWDGRRIRKF
jgi:hypothetical protein